MIRWFQHRHSDDDIAEEIRDHIERQTATHLAAGLSMEEARRRALLEFGGVEKSAEECRDVRLGHLLETLAQDTRYALRGFRRSPVFAIAAILTLALGIGAVTAVFSVVDRILFRSLPYRDADRLVSFGLLAPIEANEFMLGADYLDWKKAQTPFEAMTTWTGVGTCDLTQVNPERLDCAHVEANFLQMFGIAPVAGRDFSRADDLPNAPKVALITYGFWRSRYGARPQVLGSTVSLDGDAVTIVGILPSDFELPNLAHADFLLPQALDPEQQRHPRTGRVLRAYARLKPGVTVTQAHAELEPLFRQALKWVPPQFAHEVRLAVRPLRDRQVGDSRLASWVLLAAVLTVLLIACANVANLLLARSTARSREVAVRAALGAKRSRLVRQALTESVCLAVLGGIAGVVLAELLLQVFVRIAPQGIPRLQQANVDLRILFVTLAVVAVSGIAFGLAPAMRTPRAEELASRTASNHSRQWLRQAMVGLQVCLSLVLLSGAVLLLRTLHNLEMQPLGMRTDNLVIATVSLGPRYSTPAQQFGFFEELEQRLAGLPGLNAIGVSDTVPPSGMAHTMIYSRIGVEGRPESMEGTGGMVVWRSVTPGYFRVLGIPIVRGRNFAEQDRNAAADLVILSESFARRLFPRGDAIGQRIRPSMSGPWRTVVGIAADVKNGGIEVPSDPEYYLLRKHTPEPVWQFPTSSFLLRTSLSPSATAEWVRHTVASLDPTLPVGIDTMSQRVGKLEERPRFNAALLGIFAAMGLLLAAVGIYGVAAFLVVQRTQEIGVRMALGAQRGQVVRLVAGKSLAPVAVGSLAGVVGALVLGRTMKSLLFGVRPHDPLTLVIAALALGGIAVVATSLPARRATKVNPATALHYE